MTTTSSGTLCKHHKAASVCVPPLLMHLRRRIHCCTPPHHGRRCHASASPTPGRRHTQDAPPRLDLRLPDRPLPERHPRRRPRHPQREPRGRLCTQHRPRRGLLPRCVGHGRRATPGRVGADGTEAMTVWFTVLAYRLAVRTPQLYGDSIGRGDVPLTVRTAVPGTATVLGFLRHRVVIITVCDVAVSLRAQGV
ncbi:hypothetical protein PVAP13_3NG158701 [Panicum virgatum]|uniref:Uncharacterized protein n=1 Tax=Panicum virgatum TaxID=38727 RepID=A0A8T0U7U8_PANVG|nr:hypothetical protein PVAP13_3NG158701 [Panicum virgatum]